MERSLPPEVRHDILDRELVIDGDLAIADPCDTFAAPWMGLISRSSASHKEVNKDHIQNLEVIQKFIALGTEAE